MTPPQPALNEAELIVRAPNAILLGYPIAYSESMPNIEVDSPSIAFGDFQGAYTVIRQLGVKLLSDPYTDKPNVRLYGYQRVGGGVSNFEALKFLKFGDS